MCGICGIYSAQPGIELKGIVARMTAGLAHRGPDAEGVYVDDYVALGHRRLSILDLSPNGAQPMSLAVGGATISYNGETYNFRELRSELVREGRIFKGRSDTEVLLNAYDKWGLEGLKRFEGIFAFALWDPTCRRLVLMRDRFGVKPLFYSIIGDSLVFGSEIKALLTVKGIDRGVDQQALSEYLWYGNAYEDRTIYRAIKCLLPGHWLVVENGRIRVEAWWNVEQWLSPAKTMQHPGDAANAVCSALDSAVSRQLVADVPIGIFLSGGVDSSAIAAAAMSVQKQPLRSYSVGFDFDQGVNELPKARRVAGHLGLDHHEIRINGSKLPEVLLELVRAHDEPFADAANIPLYLLSKYLDGEIKVVLQGDGGDEMFAGYRRYAMLQNAQYWRYWPKQLNPFIRRAFGHTGERIVRMSEAAGAPNPVMRMALLLTTETLFDPPTSLMVDDARLQIESDTNPFLAYERCEHRFTMDDPVQRMLLTDITLQLPSQFLTKVDRATMANGLEVRVPLLDERVAELAVGMSSHLKVHGANRKIVLRDAIRQRIPSEIIDSPKTGFGVPYGHWLRTDLYEFARDAVFSNGFLESIGFDSHALDTAFKRHRDGSCQRGFTLWKIFQLALWWRRNEVFNNK